MTFGFVAYAAGVIAMNWLQRGNPSYKYWLIILPVLPLIYLAQTVIWAITQMDEMWRKILTEAMAFAGIATGFTCFSYLFVRDMTGVEFRAEWAAYLMWFYYGLGMMFSFKKFR